VKFFDFISTPLDGIKYIAHCEDNDKKTFPYQIQLNKKITVLIGPEGDFSSNEIAKALKHQFIPLSLGESRLRTETAGIVVCNTISVLNSMS